MKVSMTLLLAVALTAAAASAFAQAPRWVPMHPARLAPDNPARVVLRHREALGLTDEQVKRLEALAAAQEKALQPEGPERLRALADLWQAASGDVNLDAARAALERLSRLQNDAVLARLRARKEARDVLTPEQRTKLDALMRPAPARGAPHPGMRRPHGPRMGPMGPWMRPRGGGRMFRPGLGPFPL